MSAASYDRGGKEDGEAGTADSLGHSESEHVSLEGNLEHMGILDDEFEQPDGQRSSLSLDDDGGTHFEPHFQETVIRRGMLVQDMNAGSPTLQIGSGDNDVVFNPAQRLNFEDVDQDDDNEESLEVTHACNVENHTVGSRDFMPHRPGVNGSDTAEIGAYGGIPTAQDQGQNVRIIEGHDSSLLDDGGNSTFGFNFLQTQMIHLPLMSPVNMSSGLGNGSRLEDDVHNLYDSLERDDGSSLYGETDDNLMENNTSEYFRAGSMSLVVANSQVSECDSLWAQDDSPEHGSYLPHSQQHFQSGHGSERNYSKHQSPPRNFQADAASIFVPKRRDGFLYEGNMGGYGDVHSTEEDNTDALTLELSEEGLSHATQMYAQPLSARSISNISAILGSNACKGDMGISHHVNNWTNNRLSAHNNNHMSSFDNSTTKSVHHGSSNSQLPKNLVWNQGLSKDELEDSSHVEGDGIDTKSDERLGGAGGFSASAQKSTSDERPVGAGSFSAGAQKPTSDANQSARRPTGSKIQTRRPAVQGSASSGDNKRSGIMNTRQGAVPSRKSIPLAKSGSHSDTSGRLNAVVSRQNSGGEQGKCHSTGTSSASNTQSRAPHGQTSAFSMASRSSSHTSLASNASSTNSRVGGVGKESHMSTNSQASLTRGAAPPISRPESNHPMTMAQRLAGGSKGDTAYSLTQMSHSGIGISQQHQHSHAQVPNSSDSVRPAMGSQSELHKPQSFNKQHSAVHQSQNSPPIADHINEPHNLKPSDSQHLNDCQQPSSTVETGSRNLQNQTQQQQYPQQPLSNENLAFGSQQMSLQNCPTGFPGQATYSKNVSPSSSHGSRYSSRETAVTQMEAFKRQGQRTYPNEVNSQRSHLDNDIQGMEEVRGHLHRMLHMGAEASQTVNDHTDTSVDLVPSEQSLNHQVYFDADASLFIGNSHQDDMSDILENFPTFSSKMFSDMPGISSRSDSLNQGENQYLRDTLEKEKYRRKHCEEHIQKQNTKLLELQQQLAVAVSTDKRKDLMIEQLDKQLAKVVEGWKKREAEKDELLKLLGQEKENMEECLQNQQTIINSFERELSQATEELRQEKQKSTEVTNSLKAEMCEARQEKECLEQTLRAEKEENAVMRAEWDSLRESKEISEKRAQQAQERLIKEQEDWLTKEQELSTKINELQETSQRNLSMEKVKFEEQKKKREQAETQNEEMKTELKKTIQDIEQLIREKESQKVEMAIMEAKFESSQKKLEADLHGQMEKEIADQAAEFHSRIETSLEEAANRHRKQVGDLQSRHQHELEQQTATWNEERQKKEDEHRRQLNELEEKVQELRTENLQLGQSKIKLESQRMEILTKLQFMMQSQWNEAVSLLVTTPQKKSLNSSFLSSQSGGHHGSAMAIAGSNMSAASSLSLVTSGPPVMRNQTNEAQIHHSSDAFKPQTAVSTTVFENGNDQRHEEMDRMDRVEEYLQRLPHNMDIPSMRNDIAVTRNQLQNSESKLSSSLDVTGAMTHNNSVGQNYSNAVLQRHSSVPGHGLVQDSGSDDFHVKTSNNLGQVCRSYHIHGYNSAVRKSSVTSGHLARTEAMYQAVPIRCPQQSSSQYISDSGHPSATPGADLSSVPGNQHIFSYPSQGFVPPQLQHRYHTRHQHNQEQKSQSLPQQPHAPSIPSSGHSGEMRPLTGDFGDHKEVKLATGSGNSKLEAANINLYRPDSPAYVPSPTRVTTNHWSPSSGLMAQPYPSAPSLTSAVSSSSPGQEAASRPIFRVESPMKKHRSRTNQQPGRRVGELNESLSPPVKQRAEREHSDAASNSSSGCVDGTRHLVSYSQLSDHIEEHQNRQGELQHYVRMLLQKAPGSVCSEPERDHQFSDPEILESSRDLTVDLDLNDTATAAELTSQLFRLQHLREREQQLSKTNHSRNPRIQQAPSASQSNESILSHLSEFIEDTDIISSQRLAEISKFLNLYSNPEISGQSNVASQILDALKDAAVSSSVDNISGRDDNISQGLKSSPKSQQTRKVRDSTKTRRIQSESQSADSSLAVSTNSLESSSKPTSQGQSRKVPQPSETTKDKKTGTVKQPGNKNSGGPAWK